MNQVLLEKISKAISLTQGMLLETPNSKAVEAALEQLKLVQDCSQASASSRAILETINLGLLAVREFDERNPEYADDLIEIQKLIKEELGH